MKILVTGGAGYIGSAAVKALIEVGHEVIVIDNLSKGKQDLVDEKAVFYQGDLSDLEFLDKVFSENQINAVMHFASLKDAGESMHIPEKYSENISGTINLLNVMVKFNVKKIIFSSSAAVYGDPKYTPIDENHPTNPTNYYGFTKLECENIINWFSKLKGFIGINLRYFNVAGNSGLSYYDPYAKDVFSMILKTIYDNKNFIIFGNNYETRDGTCIRDFIDINDLVRAHILALNLEQSETINLGTSQGISILELVKAFEEIYGKQLNYGFGPRRDGDIVVSTASFGKAKMLLGWEPRIKLRDTIKNLLEVKKEVNNNEN